MTASRAHRDSPLALNIERLRLDGPALTPLQTQQLRQSIATELTRLHRLAPLVLQGGAIDLVRGPGFRLSAPSDPVRMGIDIARGIHGALAKST